MKKSKINKRFVRICTTLTVLMVIICRLFFGLYNLGKAAYVDERLWTYSKQKRIEKYWKNIGEHDWGHTRPSDKPGVTLAIISGPSLLFVKPSEFKNNISNKNAFIYMLFVMRLPLIIFSSLMILFYYLVIYKIFNKTTSLLATIFIGLSPILLGISRIINPDALSWIFIPITLLLFLATERNKSRKGTMFTGIFLGLAILTKYIGNILFLFFLFIIFTINLFTNNNKEKIRKQLIKSLKNYFIVFLISILTIIPIFPEVWVKPKHLLTATIWSQPFIPIWKYFVLFILLLSVDYLIFKMSMTSKLLTGIHKFRKFIIKSVPFIFVLILIAVLFSTYFTTQPSNFENFLASPKTSLSTNGQANILSALLTNFYALLFSINPFVLIGFIASITLLLITPHQNYRKNKLDTIWYLLNFILIFYLASTFSKVIATIRYQIILYPLVYIISANGWVYLIKKMSSALPKQTKNISETFIISSLIITSIITLFKIKPFYFSYNSFLLPQRYLVNLKDMGDGSYEAAQYLNSLPNAQNLKIWTDKNGVCTFFVGKQCTRVLRKKEFIAKGPLFDYFITSKGREKKVLNILKGFHVTRPGYPVRLDLLYSNNKSIWEIHPANRQANYIRITPESKIHVWRGSKEVNK